MARHKVSIERRKLVEDAAPRFFSWTDALDSYKISYIKKSTDDISLCCFLHEDADPSMNISLKLNKFHCFSCGASGSIIRFMHLLSGEQVDYNTFCDQLLKTNPYLKSTLTFDSIFITADSLDPAFLERSKFSSDSAADKSLTIDKVYRLVTKAGGTWENLAFSMSLLQAGFTPEEMLKQLEAVTGEYLLTPKPKTAGTVEKKSLDEILDDNLEI